MRGKLRPRREEPPQEMQVVPSLSRSILDDKGKDGAEAQRVIGDNEWPALLRYLLLQRDRRGDGGSRMVEKERPARLLPTFIQAG